jgi:hypothetical protein
MKPKKRKIIPKKRSNRDINQLSKTETLRSFKMDKSDDLNLTVVEDEKSGILFEMIETKTDTIGFKSACLKPAEKLFENEDIIIFFEEQNSTHTNKTPNPFNFKIILTPKNLENKIETFCKTSNTYKVTSENIFLTPFQRTQVQYFSVHINAPFAKADFPRLFITIYDPKDNAYVLSIPLPLTINKFTFFNPNTFESYPHESLSFVKEQAIKVNRDLIESPRDISQLILGTASCENEKYLFSGGFFDGSKFLLKVEFCTVGEAVLSIWGTPENANCFDLVEFFVWALKD